ncbi:hypothetical protein BV25DRAFT_1830866 [Artomyces pyxidatus]|uniref:Uncharacterized protein n=1 Tax=Artomyces pyxidatus TaxID=48021 RepID=A0ACB8SMZ3_9AGAM|nr:hypothetical protein BV25DRAFT_1830866 [Artomyces pyxidatus]
MTTRSTPNGVFTIGTSILIDAPVETVWKVLLDFPSYGEWNPFVRSQTVQDEWSSQELSVGQHLFLKVHIPPTMDDSAKLQESEEIVHLLDHEQHRVEWKFVPPVPYILSAPRAQWLTVVDGKTKYETVEAFSGPIAYVLKYVMRKNLQVSFDVMGEALKGRSEQQ